MTGVLFQGGLFLGSLLLMSVFSFFLTVALERIGVSLHLSDGLLGIVTALGADAPEISSSPLRTALAFFTRTGAAADQPSPQNASTATP